MNIENIKMLMGQLHVIGIENAASALLKRICFHPAKFTLEQKLNKGTDAISVQLFFQQCGDDFEYMLAYYDVALLPEVPMDSVNGVSVPVLESEMKTIEWIKAFALDATNPITLDDKQTWGDEARIASVVTRLDELEKTGEGRQVAVSLKQKYWSGFIPLGVMINPATLKAKSGIHQRFYLQEGQGLISPDEAYRFLLNKRMEKQRQTDKRQPGNRRADDGTADRGAAAGGLRKRKTGKQKSAGKSYR